MTVQDDGRESQYRPHFLGAPASEDLEFWQACMFRYRGADGGDSGALQLVELQAAIARGEVRDETLVEITPPGDPAEPFEVRGPVEICRVCKRVY